MFIEYKDGQKHAGTNAETSDTMDSFQDCGLLLGSDDVVIDIDHLPKESIKAVMSEFGIITQTVWTDRGAHLWFKKPAWMTRRHDGICRLGFEIEQHNKTSNPAGMTVKRNGKARQIDNFGKQMLLPVIFKVDTKYKYANLTGMDEGEGRNKALFSHRMTLMKNSAPDTERICSFINKYVFAKPLPEPELEGILRDVTTNEAGSKQWDIATEIIRECRTVTFSGTTWWYRNGEYLTDEGDARLTQRVYNACEGEKSGYVKEIIEQIKMRSPIISPGTVFPIRFRNGVLRKGEFIPIKDYRDFTPYFIDIDYKPDAASVQMVDDYIDNLTNKDHDYKSLLMEVIGYVMITDPERIRSLGKFFMFRGDGANGKGTLLEIMRRIYNGKNCSSMSIKQLVDPRYNVGMIGKLANLGDDIEAEAINNDQLKVLKNISTADTVVTRHLYHEAQDTVITAKLYFTTNSDIGSFEKGYAYKRRVVWLPMFNKVEKPDPTFISKITTREALEYWIRLIVDGYKRLYHNQTWTECQAVKDYNSQYHENNNVCLMFAKDLDPDTEILGKTISDIKEAFNQWDTEEKRFSPKLFKEAVWDLYRIGIGKTNVAGKSRRVFMLQKDSSQKLAH